MTTPSYHQSGNRYDRNAARPSQHNSQAMRAHHFGRIVPITPEPHWIVKLFSRRSK